MSDGFVIGLSSRADTAAASRVRQRSAQESGFAPADLIARIEQAFGARPVAPRAEAPAPAEGTAEGTAPAAMEDGPRHFHPADPDADPTQGWDVLDVAAEPFIDPLETARTEGYQDGLAAAMVAARDDAERDRALLATLSQALKGGAIDRAALAQQLRRTVLMLVRQLVGETGVPADLLAARIETATELLADASESAILRVNPDDVALLEGRLPGTIFPVGDAQVARGSFVLEAASTIVEDGPELWLEQMTAAIERAAVPAC